VKIVEHEDEWPRRRQSLEQLAHSPVDPVPLNLERRATTGDKRRQGRKDLAELGAHLVVKTTQPPRFKPSDVVVEGIYENPKRQVTLLLGPTSAKDQHAVGLDAASELRQQPGLADSGGAKQLDRGRPPTLKTAERFDESIEFRRAAYEMVSNLLHMSPCRG
jgi:hypothetical protein